MIHISVVPVAVLTTKIAIISFPVSFFLWELDCKLTVSACGLLWESSQEQTDQQHYVEKNSQ